MALTYCIVLTTDKEICAPDVVNIEVRTTTQVGGFALGEPWIFFNKIASPVTWDDVVYSSRQADVKAFGVVS